MTKRFLAPALTMVALLVAACGSSTPPIHNSIVGHLQPASSCPGYVTPYGCQPHSPTFGLPPGGKAPPQSLVAPQTIEQFDSIIVSTVPADARAVAGYVGGSWPTFGPLSQAFPSAKHVSIAVNAGEIADCLDVEPGDAVPSQAGGWALRMIGLGHWRPCQYTSLSEMPAVEANDSAVLGPLWRSKVRLWDADWTFFAHLDPGFDCTQWTDHALNRNLDESTCALAFYAPAPPPPDPYAVLDRTPRHFAGGVTAREYNTVKTWDRAKCQTPARRAVCRSSFYHLRLLTGRLWFVAHRLHAKPWREGRGLRFHIMWSRIAPGRHHCFSGPVTFTSCPGLPR